nr:putative protein TPRXL [Coffea arabica]
MSGHSDVTSTASPSPVRRRATRIFISSSSSPSSLPSPPPPSSSSASNPDLLNPIVIMSSPSARSPSARAVEEAAELDALIARQATSTPPPRSPHDSSGGAQGGAGEDRDASEGTPASEQGDDPELSYGHVDLQEATLSSKAVAELAKSYSIPPVYEPRAAGPNDRACRLPPSFVAIYREQLIAGLRLPIPSALTEILNH